MIELALTSEQAMIRAAVERFAAEAASNGRVDPWSSFAELGWLGIGVREDAGGFGGPLETMVLMEGLGRGAVAAPYVAQAVFPGKILERAGRLDLLRELVNGEARYAVAYDEPGARSAPHVVTTTAERVPDGYVLRGRKTHVLAAGGAETLLVSARTDDGVAIFAVPVEDFGLLRRDYVGEDGRDVAEIELDSVGVEPPGMIAGPEHGLAVLEYAFDHALGALCAEAVGVMTTMHETTVEYLKQRTQFGVPIGSFQALQHRAAEMYVELELARSMAHLAALTLAADPPAPERRRALSAAKVQIARSGRFVGQNAIQLHGAIAMTEEYKLGQYFKRMTVLERLLGDADFHLQRYLS